MPDLYEKCKEKGSACKIIIKANFSPSTQVEYKSYTDPDLVSAVVNRLHKKYPKTTVVESETKLVTFSSGFKPEKIALTLGYPKNILVANLTDYPKTEVKWKNGSINISTLLRDADVIINMAKIKSLGEYSLSVGLKNMYGALPDQDKYHLFHWKRSGFDVEDATLISNHSTHPDFIIADGVVTNDGNESSVHTKIAKDADMMHAGMIAVSRDPLSLDKIMAIKMGIGEDKSTITKREITFRGNVDMKQNPNLISIIDSKGSLSNDPTEKYAIMTDIRSNRMWKPPSSIYGFFKRHLQFHVPKVFHMSENTMIKGMCLSKYTVLTEAELHESCK